MRLTPSQTGRHYLFLVLVLLGGSALRFYGLLNQSLWVDELHTMIEADPGLTWNALFGYLRCCDQHPPLFFLIERFLFITLGYTEGTARLLPAMCGSLGILSMYWLGKEVSGRNVGLLAALLTALNYFLIEYSQEARCYIMAFLFTTLSYLFFIRLIRQMTAREMLLYVFFTLCLLYTHYYSLFIVAGQGLVALFLLAVEKDKKKLLWLFGSAGLLLLIGYLPWLPFVAAMSDIKVFWIKPIEPGFAFVYFHDYFGHSGFLTVIMAGLLIYYYRNIYMGRKEITADSFKLSPAYLSFLVFFTGITVTYLVPYIRSVLVVPMLFNRYTIVAIPGLLIMIALAIQSVGHIRGRQILIGMIIFFSLVQVIFVKEFYAASNIRKTQFREMTVFMTTHGNPTYPVVEDRTAWHHGYYLRKYNYRGPMLSGPKTTTIDHLIKADTTKGFWLVGAFHEPSTDAETERMLETHFTLTEGQDFYDGWVRLYVRKP